jgi:lipopolysaccharide transport system ATP-binding protein
MAVAISASSLSKRYVIGAARHRHNTLRDELVYGFKSLVAGRQARRSSADARTLWAIKDLSFEVAHGEVLGIVGRNGAGKSTLLKILSRITEPTTGWCKVYGRMASLLEVGTGFHSELTGRENVYLNGAILGMKKAEIDRNFDAIVAFAEVGKFIDTPVKRYSSGMHVRLAFAVAAHLEPEILIVDEVLAVGDLSFQNKCIGKMSEVAREGRTVLFVSHNMGAVSNLCTSGMWIDQGRVRQRGSVSSIVSGYVREQSTGTQKSWKERRRAGTGEVRVVDARLVDVHDHECSSYLMGETLILDFDVEATQTIPQLHVTVGIMRRDMGIYVTSVQNGDCAFDIGQVRVGRRRFRVEIPNCLLHPTSYEIRISLWDHERSFDSVEGVAEFAMVQSGVTQRTSALTNDRESVVYTPSIWKER